LVFQFALNFLGMISWAYLPPENSIILKSKKGNRKGLPLQL